MFATTEPQKIMQTAAPVLSWVQRFDLKRIGSSEIRERPSRRTSLAKSLVGAEPEELSAPRSRVPPTGRCVTRLSLTDQVLSMSDGRVTAERVRDALGLVPEDEYIAVLDLIADRRAADVFPTVARLAEAGVDFGGFLTGLADMLRAQLSVALGRNGGGLPRSGRVMRSLERKERLAAADLLRMLQALGELEPRFRKSGQQQLLIETLLVRFALLDRSIELEDLLRSMGNGGGGGSGGGGGAPTPCPSGTATSPPRLRLSERARPRRAKSEARRASSRLATGGRQ